MEKTNNQLYRALSKNLYILLTKKYNIKESVHSTGSLSDLALKLGNRLKQISYDEADKILNVNRTLNDIGYGYSVSDEEVNELESLYAYFKKTDKNKQVMTSRLEIYFNKLSMKSKDAIINENEFDNFKEYMHIKRPIQSHFEDVLLNYFPHKRKAILFIVGNVGDGKSHILSYMMKKHQDVFQKYNIKVHNDATETDSPKSTALETMRRILQPFSDNNINNEKENRLVVAINLGVMTNLLNDLKMNGQFDSLVSFLENSQVLSSRMLLGEAESPFKIISFTEQPNFEINGNEVKSEFYSSLIDRIFNKDDNNPFYTAYKDDINKGMNKLLHANYEYMLRDDFKKAIVHLLIRAEIEFKIIVSTRMLFNFLHDITMPRDSRSGYDSYLPFLLFENKNKSELLTIIGTLDPTSNQTRRIDEISIELYHSQDYLLKLKELLQNEYQYFDKIFQSFKDEKQNFNNFINTYLRIKFLCNFEDNLFDNTLYNNFLTLYSTVQNGEEVEELFELVNESFSKWNGDSGIEGYIIKNPGKGRIKVLVELDLEPEKSFISGYGIGLKFKINNEPHDVVIDYRTFSILSQLNNGYFLKDEDRQVATNFSVFVNKIINSAVDMKKNIILDLKTQTQYELKTYLKKITLSERI